jgi:hypothetical protein
MDPIKKIPNAVNLIIKLGDGDRSGLLMISSRPEEK